MPRRCGLIACWLLLAVSVSCSPDGSPSVGGDTHWLTACIDDTECGEHACLCGICTRRCSTDDACARGPDAACYDARSPSLLQRCEAGGAQAVGGVCLAECASDAECGEQQVCMHGACLRVDEPVAGQGGSDGSAGSAGGFISAMPSSKDLEGVSDDVPWVEPVVAPRPEAVFTGDELDRLVGTWIEPGCDPAAVAPIDSPAQRGEGCFRFVVERSAGGEVSGAIFVEPTPDAFGPFAPATDPNVGWPTEVEPLQWGRLTHLQPQVPYRMLDGRFENGRLTFWLSGMDLWHDWCLLQTSHLWQVGEHTFHACVPQAAESLAALDQGKVILCTSFVLCQQPADGKFYPCGCPNKTDSDPRCGGTVCDCDGAGCDADVEWHAPLRIELTFDGDRLTGTARYSSYEFYPVTMERAP